MASYRHPKGVYIRPTPDWSAKSLCVIGDWDQVAVGSNTVTTWSFLNNDQLGRYIYINAINAFGDNALGFQVGWSGSAGGSIVQFGQWVQLDQGQSPGVLYRRIDTPPMGSDQNVNVPNPQMAITNFYGTMVNLPGAAMFILPTGNFLVVGSNPSGGNNYLTIWYTVLATN